MGNIKSFDDFREWVWEQISGEREHIIHRLESKVHGMDDDFPFTDMEQARSVGYLEGLEHVDERLRSLIKYELGSDE